MGMPFPQALQSLAQSNPALVPWAWAINGCASVTAGVLAIVLAMSHGFGWVWSLSVFIYALGVAVLLSTTRRLRRGIASP